VAGARRPLLLAAAAAAADDVLADRFQVQAGRAPTLVADVMVRPADRGETVVDGGGRVAAAGRVRRGGTLTVHRGW